MAAAGAPTPALTPDTSPQPEKAPAKPAEDAPKQPEKAPPTPATPPADPSTEDILRDMEKQRGTAPVAPSPSPAATQPATPAPGQPAVRVQNAGGRLLREGTFLVERRGRLVRATTGDWLYTFDADAKGQADPTMVVLPCQKLEGMEKLAERYGESLSFTITGQVFVYKNRNYILPATFRVNRAEDDIKSAQ
jgi:hypothetical protein